MYSSSQLATDGWSQTVGLVERNLSDVITHRARDEYHGDSGAVRDGLLPGNYDHWVRPHDRQLRIEHVAAIDHSHRGRRDGWAVTRWTGLGLLLAVRLLAETLGE